MARLTKSDVETVLNFLREKIDADDLPQIQEILTRNADDGGEADPIKRNGTGMDPRGATGMDSRRAFEKQNGIASRPIRVLG